MTDAASERRCVPPATPSRSLPALERPGHGQGDSHTLQQRVKPWVPPDCIE